MVIKSKGKRKNALADQKRELANQKRDDNWQTKQEADWPNRTKQRRRLINRRNPNKAEETADTSGQKRRKTQQQAVLIDEYNTCIQKKL